MSRLAVFFFLVIGLFTLGESGYAQVIQQDVLYLKDGRVIRGTITELVVNETVKIETQEGDFYTFKWGEVAKIKKEPLHSEPKESDKSIHSKKSYAGYFSFGLNQIIFGANSTTLVAIHFVNGFHIRNSTLGIGIGVEFGIGANNNITIPASNNALTGLGGGLNGSLVIPIWIDSRTFLSKGDDSPFLWSHIGYSFGSAQGFSVCTGAGLCFDPSSGLSPTLELGFRIQCAENPNFFTGSYGAVEALFGFAF